MHAIIIKADDEAHTTIVLNRSVSYYCIQSSPCYNTFMMLHTPIDTTLLQEAMQLGNHHTRREVIEEALREYVKRRKQLRIIDYFGRIEYEDDFDYKVQRHQQ